MNNHAACSLKRARFIICFLWAAFFWPTALHALTITSAATGNWNAVTTWAIVTAGIPGRISTSTASATVTGNASTLFLQLKPGDELYTTGNVVVGTIQSVASNTSLTLTANAAVNLTNALYRIRKVPDANDSASVGTTATHVVTIPAGYAAQIDGLTIGATTTNDAAVTLGATTSSLTAGAVSINRTSSTPRTHALNVDAGTATLASVTITGGAGSRAGQLAISTGTATITGALSFAGTASNARVTFSGSGILRVGGAFGAGGTLTPSTGTVEYNGAAQAVQAEYSYYNLTLGGTGTKTPSATKTGLNVTGTLTLNSGVTYDGTANNPALNVGANFSDSGTFNSGTGVFTFNGTVAQQLTGTNTDTTFTNLTIDNAAGLTLNHNATVNGTFTFSNGRITTGANAVVVGTGGTIATPGTSSYVVGNFRKAYTAGASLNYVGDDFPVGDATNYTPVNITAGTTTTAGTLTVSTTPTDHPQVTTPIASTGIDATLSVNRYWTFVSNGVATGTAIAATFNFINPGDLDPGASTFLFIAQRYDQTLWQQTTLNAASSDNTQVGDIVIGTGTHDFAIGQPLPGGGPAPVGRFNVFQSSTAANALEGVIYTKQAGVSVSDLDIIHVNPSKTNYQGGAVTVEIQLLDASAGGATDADGCSTTDAWPLVQALPDFTFASRATLTAFTVPDSYRNLRFRVRYPVGGPYSQIGCSQDNFAVRPQSLTVSARDDTWLTNAAPLNRQLDNASATGGNVHAAGSPFTIRVVAEPNASVTLYNGTPTLVSGSPACGSLCTALGSLTLGAWSGTGTRDSTAQYSEAGTVSVQFEDATWSAVDDFDGSTAAMRTIPATATVEIGRFVPHHFDVAAAGSAPQFVSFCPGAPGFTYIGQPFAYATGLAPTATITAKNASGATTANYRASLGLWKIGTGSASVAKDCTSNPDVCVFTTSWATNLGAVTESYSYSLAPASTPNWDETATAAATASVASNNDGTGTVTFSNAGRLAFRRGTTPLAPFTASITNTVTAQDNSEAAVSGNGTIGTTSNAVFANIPFDSALDNFRYGRLRLQNALASSGALAARMPIEAQYWSSAGFFVANDDSCTSFAAGDFALSPNLSGGSTSITGAPFTLSGGKSTLTLAAPGAANKGFVTVTATLGTNFPWLQGAWPGPAYNQNPAARATWGLFGSQPRNFIFQRENY